MTKNTHCLLIEVSLNRIHTLPSKPCIHWLNQVRSSNQADAIKIQARTIDHQARTIKNYKKLLAKRARDFESTLPMPPGQGTEPRQHDEKDLVDNTDDEEDLERAIKMSLEVDQPPGLEMIEKEQPAPLVGQTQCGANLETRDVTTANKEVAREVTIDRFDGNERITEETDAEGNHTVIRRCLQSPPS